MKTIVDFYIKYRKNILINTIFSLVLLFSSILIFSYIIKLEHNNLVLQKTDIALFLIGLTNLLFGYRRLVNVIDHNREAIMSKKIIGHFLKNND